MKTEFSDILSNPVESHPQKLYSEYQIKEAYSLGKKSLADMVRILSETSKIDGTKQQIAKAYHHAFIVTNELTKDA